MEGFQRKFPHFLKDKDARALCHPTDSHQSSSSPLAKNITTETVDEAKIQMSHECMLENGEVGSICVAIPSVAGSMEPEPSPFPGVLPTSRNLGRHHSCIRSDLPEKTLCAGDIGRSEVARRIKIQEALQNLNEVEVSEIGNQRGQANTRTENILLNLIGVCSAARKRGKNHTVNQEHPATVEKS